MRRTSVRQAAPVRQASPVPPDRYSTHLLETFAAGEHADFLAAGGRPLRPRLARALALAALAPGLAVVDVGCGRGEAALHAARRGAIVTAVDFSPGSLALVRQTLEVGLSGRPAPVPPRLLRADATGLPLTDASADRVLLLDVVEHLHPWQLSGALAEARRILRPAGHVVIHTLPNRWAMGVAYPLLRALAAPGLPADARSPYERAVHVNEQSPATMAQALAEAGMEHRVWVEEWTTRHAARASGREFPDAARAEGYRWLRRRLWRRLARLAMATPLAPCVGNDIFALAWHRGAPAPPTGGRWLRVR